MSLYTSFYKLLIMYLVVQDVKSEKVKFVQSKFDVGDFNHCEKKVKSSNKDKTYESELMKPFINRKDKKLVLMMFMLMKTVFINMLFLIVPSANLEMLLNMIQIKRI